MSKIISIILYFIICAAGIAVAIMSVNQCELVMWLGIVIALFTMIVGLLTTRDIDKLQKSAKTTVHYKECEPFKEFADVEEVIKQ